MWEIVCSICRSQTDPGRADFGVWRNATSRNSGKNLIHTVTPLGRTLLDGA